MKRRHTKSKQQRSKKPRTEKVPIYTGAQEAVEAITSGNYDVVILDLNIEFDLTGIFDFYNVRVKPHARIRSFDLNSSNIRFPGKNAGMLNNYASPQANRLIDMPDIQHLFALTTGTPNWKLKPNRMRFNTHNDDKGDQSIHIEGMNVLQDTTEISFIVCATPGRTFTYYKGSRKDEYARELYRAGGGCYGIFLNTASQ